MTSPAADAPGIVAFIEARLDEREEAARDGIVACMHVELCDDAGSIYLDRIRPEFVLAEVAKDRAILALHQPEEAAVGGAMCAMCNPWRPDAQYPCQTVWLLAAVDADHSDFDPSWKPVAG